MDDEVSRVINQAYTHAKDVLTEHRALLDAIAASLLEHETLTRDDFALLIRGEKLPPRVSPPTGAPVTTPIAAAAEPKRVPPLLGGPEPSPA